VKATTRIFLAMLLTLAPALAVAQDKPAEPKHFYRLLLRLQDVDANGKVVNTRSYTTSIATQDSMKESIRTSSRFLISQNNYSVAGVDIDAMDASEYEGELSFSLSVDVNSLVPPSEKPSQAPVTRNNRWSSRVSVPINKPTVVFSSDNIEDKGKMQMEVTATPEK
jgi:hypothetical protein